MLPSTSRTRWRLLLAAAVVVQLAGLYAPRGPDLGGVAVPGSDKVAHIAMFGAVVLTGLLAGLPPRWVIGLSLAHAGASELIQHAVLAERSGDALDVVADAVGVALGAVAARWWAGLSSGGRPRSAPDR